MSLTSFKPYSMKLFVHSISLISFDGAEALNLRTKIARSWIVHLNKLSAQELCKKEGKSLEQLPKFLKIRKQKCTLNEMINNFQCTCDNLLMEYYKYIRIEFNDFFCDIYFAFQWYKVDLTVWRWRLLLPLSMTKNSPE